MEHPRADMHCVFKMVLDVTEKKKNRKARAPEHPAVYQTGQHGPASIWPSICMLNSPLGHGQRGAAAVSVTHNVLTHRWDYQLHRPASVLMLS